MNNQEERRKAVAWGLAVTSGTPIAPDAYEQALLAAFVEGNMTLDEVVAKLEERARPEVSTSHMSSTER